MKLLPHPALILATAGLLFCSAAEVQAQMPASMPQMPDSMISGARGVAAYGVLPADYAATENGIPPVRPAGCTLGGCQPCAGCAGGRCGCGACFTCPNPGFYAGAEYLLMRPHFSEAIAFAQGTQTLPTAFEVEGRELQFDYDNSFRVFAGYRTPSGGEFRFTYWYLFGDISVEGTATGTEFIVDPFGNVVGALRVMDLGDVRGFGTLLTAGDHIATRATVRTNVYDFDFIKPLALSSRSWAFSCSAGARIADIDQYYESLVTLAGAPLASGDFSSAFIGAGPRLGAEARRYFGETGRLSLFVNGHAALLLGENEIRSSTAPNTAFQLAQSESLTRTIPVLEAELGLAWQVRESLSLSAGWVFQAWFDLGVSGGQFGGFFAGADDANIMSFDGLSARAEWTF